MLPEPRVHVDKFSGKKHAACKDRKPERENLTADLEQMKRKCPNREWKMCNLGHLRVSTATVGVTELTCTPCA